MTNPLVKKGLPTFPKNENTNNSTNVNNNVSTNTNNIEKYYTPVDKIIKKQVSIYLDEDVIAALNQFGKDHGKGAKSDLVNNFLKETFNIRQGEIN